MNKNIRLKIGLIALITFCLGLVLGIGGTILFTKTEKKQSNEVSVNTAEASKEAVVETTTPEETETPTPTIETTPSETPEETEEAEEEIYGVVKDENGNYCVDGDDLLIIANKHYKLTDGYEPDDLEYGYECTTGACYMRSPASEAVREMIDAAANDGITLRYSSAYRGEAYQSKLYNKYVGLYGVAGADEISSRPGYSDHQTGLACDFISNTNSSANFNAESYAQTVEGQWLAENAYKYGFIQRYPSGKSDITGYSWESWHYRYVGVEYATAMHEEDPDNVNISMEEYFDFEGGDYVE